MNEAVAVKYARYNLQIGTRTGKRLKLVMDGLHTATSRPVRL